MKNLILILMTLGLAACSSGGGGGGNGGGGGHIPDNTPHDYAVTVSALTNTNQPHPVDLHQVCDFGYPEVRDEVSSIVLQDPNIVTGVGCTAAKNYLFEVDNVGTDVVYVVVQVDGVNLPQEEIQPGETFTFQRGY